jgi:hypothetical protein
MIHLLADYPVMSTVAVNLYASPHRFSGYHRKAETVLHDFHSLLTLALLRFHLPHQNLLPLLPPLRSFLN